MSSGNRLGELLVREKRISLTQLKAAQDEQKRTGQNLTYALAKLGYICEKEITNFLSQQYRVPTINLDEYEIDAEIGKLVSKEICEKHRIIPVSRAGNLAHRRDERPDEPQRHRRPASFLTGYNVEPVIASENAILAAIERMFQAQARHQRRGARPSSTTSRSSSASEEESDAQRRSSSSKASEDAPIVRLVQRDPAQRDQEVRASDIHIEPYEKKLRVRYRIDGVLREEMYPPLKLKNAISSRLKIMASLDIAERRLPQDGRIKLKMRQAAGRWTSACRVLPTIWGEKIVMRLLDKANLQLDMTKLGFEQQALERLHEGHPPARTGMVLVTGPTGSGKTTTLYSALSELNKIADEHHAPPKTPSSTTSTASTRCQMHDDIGLNFAAALRSFLRQDPDIIMVGEIRDFETAEIARQGRAHGPPGALDAAHQRRPGDDLAPAQHGHRAVPGDRRRRTSCSPSASRGASAWTASRRSRSTPRRCARSASRRSRSRRPTAGSGRARAAANCNGTGYSGRVALYEVMPIRDELKEMVLQGASTAELKTQAIRCGMRTLRMSGITKCLEGVTTTEEIIRVTLSDVNKSAS